MQAIVECIPNFSEGRRQPVIDALVAAVRGAGATLLDVQADAEQNRCVVRFAGGPTAVERAALAAAEVAVAQIDLRQHEGRHPRIGALDVLPFVPVSGMSIEDCAELARRVGARLARDHELPVYLYGAAARRPEREELGELREGEYEGLAERIATDPERAPDLGPRRLGPAGACIVGARHPKVYAVARLEGASREAAEALAARLAEEGGGLRHLALRVVEVPEEGLGLALTLDRIDRSPLHRALYLLEAEARAAGLRVAGTELVGMLPQQVLDEAAAWHMGLQGLRPEQVIERRVAGTGDPHEPGLRAPRAFVESVAAGTATPGGGAVAALAGALGAALAGMVARLTAGRPKYETVDAAMLAISAETEGLQSRLVTLMDEDAAAFEAVMEAYRMPRVGGPAGEERREAIQAALRHATAVPLEVMRCATEVLDLAERVAESGNASAVSDAGVAALMAQAAVRSAGLNVEINVMGLRDLEEGDRYRAEASALTRQADRRGAAVEQLVRGRIGGGA